MQTRIYKLSASAVADSAGAANITVQQNGIVSAVLIDQVGLLGAAVDGRQTCEVSFTNQSGVGTNDTIGQIAQASVSGMIASSATSAGCHVGNIAVPVRAGDRINLNVEATGTAFAQSIWTAYVYVAY